MFKLFIIRFSAFFLIFVSWHFINEKFLNLGFDPIEVNMQVLSYPWSYFLLDYKVNFLTLSLLLSLGFALNLTALVALLKVFRKVEPNKQTKPSKLLFAKVVLTKHHFLGIAILSGIVAIGSFVSHFYYINKASYIKEQQGLQLVSDARSLNLLKILKSGLDNGEIKAVNAALTEIINDEKSRISAEISNVELNQFQLDLIKNAISDNEFECQRGAEADQLSSAQ
ncbi:hypothetical protein [Thalassotalea agarivorans]|uniref:Uncharacterized protein n=1 Tax=Thalassotalea agarivorans TaxID=349064 RepID=A0A1I0GWB0_THASX|nr:hypothetical protein [Thalassotalea agarivorans]SET75536.1 hypothetical protein SAMN05660429_02603 [Thalassotalea agarivorans]